MSGLVMFSLWELSHEKTRPTSATQLRFGSNPHQFVGQRMGGPIKHQIIIKLMYVS